MPNFVNLAKLAKTNPRTLEKGKWELHFAFQPNFRSPKARIGPSNDLTHTLDVLKMPNDKIGHPGQRDRRAFSRVMLRTWQRTDSEQ